MTDVHVVLELAGGRHGFTFQPCCPLHKFKTCLRKTFGLELESVVIMHHGMRRRMDLADETLHVVESLGVLPGDILVLDGPVSEEQKQPPTDLDGVPLHDLELLMVETGASLGPLQVAQTITGRLLLRTLAHQRIWVPDTIKVFRDAEGQVRLREDELVNAQQQKTVHVSGTVFPLPPAFDFLDNAGVHLSGDCVVCLQSLASGATFRCGHLCVCAACRPSIHLCPLCRTA